MSTGWPEGIFESPIEIHHIVITPVGKQSSSYAKLKFGCKYLGFFVFLKEKGVHDNLWKCISVAIGPIDNKQVLPSSYEQVNELTWNGYCYANRICDGELMSRYFHPTCRLTYTGPDNHITICESDAFYAKVSGRYETEASHQPYAHWKNDPRLETANSLLSIDFATSQLAMVVLKIGHPPFLWTDLLTCAQLSGDDNARWWIVHKSSDCEPHPFIS